VPGELGDLAVAMQSMRQRLEGREYIENYIRALTHELKSPMAAIRASGELLQDDLSQADRAQFAGQVVAQSQRVQRLVERMLELTKLEQRTVGHQGIDSAAGVALADCVQDALSAHHAQITIKNIAARAVYTASNHKIDREMIALAVSNLLENAIDFSPAGSAVDVSCTAHSIVVQDYAGGVPDYALARLGERFFTTPRPDGARSGSGLGLAIVRQIMALHGGELRLANAQGGLRAELVFKI
jgi:two-component system, OmpR family, sensor histidine kinase CreC